MNAMASPHPVPSPISALGQVVIKALHRAFDLMLQIGLRLAGLGCAALFVSCDVWILTHWPGRQSDLPNQAAPFLVCALWLVLTILCIQFAWRTVSEIVRTGGAHWFSHWTLLAIVNSALLIAFIASVVIVGQCFLGLAAAVIEPSDIRREIFRSGPEFATVVKGIVALPLIILSSRYTWKLEGRWFPERISHPLFGRWLEWEGARS